MKPLQTHGFTLVELIIGMTLFSIFVLMGTNIFTSAISNIQYIKVLGEEQESMLYDVFMIDEILGSSHKVKQFIDPKTQTGYLFWLDREKYNHSFATLDFNYFTGATRNYYQLAIKKMIPLNDITFYGADIIYTAPGENDVKNILTNASVSSTWSGYLNQPTGLLPHSGQLYISDTGNSCIRRASDISACFIGKEKQPGNDSTSLISPTYLVGTGNILYISDTYNNKIRRVDITSTGNIIDIFGNGNFADTLTSTFTGLALSLPTGLALDGNILFVSDTGNNRILKLNTSTGTGEVLIGNGKDDTVFVQSGSISTPNLMPISHPTDLFLTGGRLYFTEALNGVVKSISLSPPYTIYNEFGSYKNIAYFGDFENMFSTFAGYNLQNFSGSIVDNAQYVPYSGDFSYRLLGQTASSGSFVYNFSGMTLSSFQKIDLSFYIKSLSGAYDISYGFVDSSGFIPGNSLTGIVDATWKKFFLSTDIPVASSMNGIKIDISGSSFSGGIFLMDDLEIVPHNLHITGNTSGKLENNHEYISSAYINGNNSFVSNVIEGKNYRFDLVSLPFTQLGYIFSGLKNSQNKYLFDDYVGNTKLDFYTFEDTKFITYSGNYIVGMRYLFHTLNGYFLDKYISIKK